MKFDVVVCIEQLVLFSAGMMSPRVRIRVVDAQGGMMGDDLGQGFVSEGADPGNEPNTFIWSDITPARVEFKAVLGLPSRKVVVEVLDDGSQEGSASFYAYVDVFRMEGNEVVGINEGVLRKSLFGREEGYGQKPKGAVMVRVEVPVGSGAAEESRFEAPIPVADVPRSAWIPVAAQDRKGRDTVFRIGDSFDVYIDGARFLPENVTMCRVVARVVSAASGKIVNGSPEICGVSDLNSLFHSPSFNIIESGSVRQVREAITMDIPDPTSVLVIKLYTLDRDIKEMRLIGSTMINCFVDARTKEQPVGGEGSQYYLNAGGHQLPVFVGEVGGKAGMRSVEWERALRVPCATVLVRLERVPYGKKTREEPVPDYSTGAYVSMLSTPMGYEKKLYPHVLSERGSVTVDEVLAKWMGSGQENGKPSATSIDTYIQKCLTTPKHMPPQLALTAVAKYQPKYGFKICVESATNLRGKGFHFAVVSLCPGGLYEAPKRIEGDVWIVKKVKGDSDVRHPRWGDGFHLVRKQFSNGTSVVIVDVKSFDPEDESHVVDEGWGAVPVFAEGEYCTHGVFQLPLFEGTPPPGLIRQLKKEEMKPVLAAALKNKTIRVGRKYPSVFVKADSGYDMKAIVNTDLLPKGGAKAFAPNGRDRAVRSLVPSGEDEEAFVAECAQRFAAVGEQLVVG
ncbi:Coiled-coil domain-containing protein 17 [Rhizophlyctis rosea]|uniref:Coiled-coil domain-containing protein 17 n=1 Tax=Rhizophlyctis rosea TaxID=64517 RepID=A0AAD5S2Z2_9FUNG|nr:Coiled-coil domain-containing protein 17 [Rhizophlyctis rosea]